MTRDGIVGKVGEDHGYDDPQIDGEKLASWLRIILGAICIVFLIGYFNTTPHSERHALIISIVLGSAWSLLGAGYLLIIGKGYYRPFMSYFSTLFDLAVVTVMQVVLIMVLPLNFVNGPITSLYFVTIGLAALRKSRLLVFMTGISAALIHLIVSGVFMHIHFPSGHLVAEINGHAMEITILDGVGVALCLATVGWVIGRVTKEFRDSESHYHVLFEHVPDGIVITSSERRILAANRRFADMVGVEKDALLSRDVNDFLGHGIHSAPVTPFPFGFVGSPTILIRADGTKVPVRTQNMPMEYQGEPCVEMSVRNAAEQVHLERRLAQSQKMETIGRLAAGLAHNFNNILGGILGAASLVRRTLGKVEPSPSREKLDRQVEIIKECGDRARDVVQRLLTFSRTSIIETEPVDLESLARKVASIGQSTFGSEIDIRITNKDDSPIVMGDTTSLTQALLNLCINASDAMASKGVITIEIAQVEYDDPAFSRHPHADGDEDYCRITVTDTGVGIDESIMERIFDPFFTTKPPGEGTGLGLSMVYNIARQHGGFLDVSSTPGEGASFHMYLTRARKSLLPPEPEERLPRGTGTILVVDDEEIARTTIQGMLSELGYRVSTATSGPEAIEIFTATDGAFDLLVLDMLMPEMSGSETLGRIREKNDNVKVVVTSGFMDSAGISGLAGLEVSSFLRKPFTFMALARAVHDTLKGH